MRKPGWLRAVRRYPSILLLPIFSAISVCVTVWMAARRMPRLSWMVVLSLCFLFLNALNRRRLRNAFKTLRNYRIVRKMEKRREP